MRRVAFAITSSFCLLIAARGLCQATTASAAVDVREARIRAQSFGPYQNVKVLGAIDFRPAASGVTYSSFNDTNGYAVFQTSLPPVNWLHGISLDSGVTIDGIELEACDSDIAGQIFFGILKWDENGGTTIASGATGVETTPGCNMFWAEVASPQPFRNRLDEAYAYFGFSGSGSSILRVTSARIYYTRTVSPAPGVATFSDVPTGHPLFRFVEALAASGVTAGCGGGNFCPNSPLTRGQMAVFLSSALGLYW